MKLYKDMGNVNINKLILSAFFGFVLGIVLVGGKSTNKPQKNSKESVVYVYDTCIIYRDTCDSQFFKAIIETETRNYTRLHKGTPPKDSLNSMGKYIGLFQMSKIYFEGCDLARVLGYTYEQMHNPELSFHVFYAKMGVYAWRFRKKYKRLPSYEELARIHCGGFSNVFSPITNKYANYFNKCFNKTL